MSGVSATPGLPASLARQWQGPLLVVAATALGAGLWRAAHAQTPHAKVDLHVRAQSLLAAGHVLPGVELIEHLLGEGGVSGERRAWMHHEAATALYEYLRGASERRGKDLHRAIRHYHAAERMGAGLSPDEFVRVADLNEWLGAFEPAARAIREALDRSVRGAGHLRRRLARWIEQGRIPGGSDDVRQLADDILADGQAMPVDVSWALDVSVSRLAEAARPEDALDLLNRHAPRLAGTPHRDLPAYLRALALSRMGEVDEAEGLVRELLGRWQPHDELWARASLLLGELCARGDRPQESLGLFEEVLKSFPAGRLHDAALMGRAEALVGLERFGEAADVIDRVVAIIEHGSSDGVLDRDAVRALVRTAARRLEGRDDQPGADDEIRFLEMSARLLRTGDVEEATFLYERIADLCEKESLTARTRGNTERARRMAVRGAQAAWTLASREATRDEVAGRNLWRAAELFEAGGDDGQAVSVMAVFGRRFPGSPRMAESLRRLGHLHAAAGRRSDAIDAYRRVLHDYPRTIDAMQSVLPLADAMLAGADRHEAIGLLESFVEPPPGSDLLVTPQAPEYREALIRLATLRIEDGHDEDAIFRLEKALALYPDDLRVHEWRFMLGELYRRSGLALSASDAESQVRESRRRLRSAMELFGSVAGDLGCQDEDRLSDVERVRLRASYMRRADCLFELGDYGAAAAAYGEALWRFDREPTAVVAGLQIVQCRLRLGRPREARRALEQVRWLIGRVPADLFDREPGLPPREFWKQQVDDIEGMGLLVDG